MRRLTRAVPVLLLLVSLGALFAPQRAITVPLYAARNGMMCASCHFDPNGGGPRNEFGFNFAKNRHSMVPDTSGPWKDLTLVNRVGDNFPLYFGLNQRFLLLSTQTVGNPDLDAIGFANMENDIHLAFQPHPSLTLVYTLYATDAAGGSFRINEAFGMFNGMPMNSYVKAGRFRTPFGLRMDDHTVATRNGFLDFLGGGSFLPYDPRGTDAGVEVGAESHGIFGRASFTNGRAPLVINGAPAFSEAKTLKLGYNNAWYQNGLSLYDDIQKVGSDPRKRFTRWGYYAMTHWRNLSVLGEIAKGTDADLADTATTRTNLLAGFVQADYQFNKWINVRGRFDEMDMNHSGNPVIRKLNTYYRYSLEGEIVPVPFAELRWTFRYIEPRAKGLADERQAYLMAHFSY
jgi:hypothetical protein